MSKELKNSSKNVDIGSEESSEPSPSSRNSFRKEYNQDDDHMSNNSKKIRKKRNTYQKIDDETRIKLLEAVQQNGETLKSAAKRYGINYSSAKSILHTYRKEGRILKKSCQDRNPKKASDSVHSFSPARSLPEPIPLQPSITRNNFKHPLKIDTSKNESNQETMFTIGPESCSPSVDMNRLTDNFINVCNINGIFDENYTQQQKNFLKVINQAGYLQNIKQGIPRFKTDEKLPFNTQNEQSPYPKHTFQNTQPVNDSIEKMKIADTSYMNYSNSPLSSEKIIKDGSSKSNHGFKISEYDTFSDMINALSQKKPSEEIKEEIHIPRPLRFNTAQKFQEQIEAKINGEENLDWKDTLESAALDTFKTVVDAQMLLCDALKKASILNNLVQMTKTRDQTDFTETR